MKQNSLTDLAIAVGTDALEIFHIPTNTLQVLGKMMVGKTSETDNLFRDVLIDCKRSPVDLNEREKEVFNEECYLIYQYTIQGKARHNRELMIKFLKGQIDNENLYLDDFYKYMDVLANLTVDEIYVLSELKKVYDKMNILGRDVDYGRVIEVFLDNVCKEDEKNYFRYMPVLQSLTRTGFVIPCDFMKILKYNKEMINYKQSFFLFAINKSLINFFLIFDFS